MDVSKRDGRERHRSGQNIGYTMKRRCIRDLKHLGNQIRRPRALRSGRLNIGFHGVLNHVYTSVSSYNVFIPYNQSKSMMR